MQKRIVKNLFTNSMIYVIIAKGFVDSGMILRFSLKCLGIFTLIFIGAVFTPKIAKYIDQWKAKHSHPRKKQEYSVRSIYELPPEPRKKAKVRKKSKKK